MQVAAPLPRPVRRFLPVGGLRPRPILLAVLVLGVLAGLGIVAYQRFSAADLQAAQAAVVQAQATLADANGKLQTLVSGATNADRAAAQAGLVSAQNTLATAQAKLDQLQAGPLNADVVSTQSAVAQANST